jgi:MEDS: MEthanogen/methylotroph, DcmR Sensory domain
MWRDSADFTSGLVTFIEDGLEAGEPVMVALIREHTHWLRDALGAKARKVQFVDMGELGSNPARIIPAWQQFLDAYSGHGRPVRGIGEPIWAGRRDEEILECQLHEALLNVAVHPEIPFWLICPYDAAQLDSSVLEEAHRSHPAIVEAHSYQGSARYGGRAHVSSMFASELPDLAGQPTQISFRPENLDRIFAFVALDAYAAGLQADKASDLAAATQRLAAGSMKRGAGGGNIRIWHQSRAVICELADETYVGDLLAGRHEPSADNGDGLWFANQLCDLVQLRSTPSGTTVRVHAWK